MANWVDRVLAALGLGGRKAESDVSYDQALDEEATGQDKPAEPERPEGGPWASG